jgi:nucleoside-diphosphate kinase
MEKTLVLIKPDAVERSLIGRIITHYEENGLRVVSLRMVHADEETATAHYVEHVGRPYFPGLLAYITRSPLVAMVLEGQDAIALVRRLNGKTNPAEAEKGTIRGLYGVGMPDNTVHSSDTPENAEREAGIWFGN